MCNNFEKLFVSNCSTLYKLITAFAVFVICHANSKQRQGMIGQPTNAVGHTNICERKGLKYRTIVGEAGAKEYTFE